jgi:hypothetical protein
MTLLKFGLFLTHPLPIVKLFITKASVSKPLTPSSPKSRDVIYGQPFINSNFFIQKSPALIWEMEHIILLIQIQQTIFWFGLYFFIFPAINIWCKESELERHGANAIKEISLKNTKLVLNIILHIAPNRSKP